MAVVRFTNLQIVDDIFTQNMNLAALELNALVSSGIAVADGEIGAFLSNPLGGRTFNPRFYNALANDVPNISSDDPASASTPNLITTGKQTAIRQSRNQSWSSMDLVTQINGDDPIGAIRSKISQYWATQNQSLMISSLLGVLADNVANDSGDMLVDLCVSGTETVGDTNLFSKGDCIDALATMGDQMGAITAIGVHSMIYARMLKNDMIDFVPDSATGFRLAFYGDKRIIVDDGLAPETETVNSVDVLRYTNILYGAGAIGTGQGSAKVPLATERDESAGTGSGQETLFSRVEQVVHPRGFAWVDGSVAGESPTNAECKLAANWNRVHERKRIPLAFLQTNG